MSKPRNVITLSNMDPDLEEWAREEARRSGKHFYEVINQALRIYQVNKSLLEVGRLPSEEEAQEVAS